MDCTHSYSYPLLEVLVFAASIVGKERHDLVIRKQENSSPASPALILLQAVSSLPREVSLIVWCPGLEPGLSIPPHTHSMHHSIHQGPL